LHLREDAYLASVIDRLRSADLILLNGGSPERAHEVMTGTPALEAVRVASAAGAAIAGFLGLD
jgi:cyanophycinase-like exopeptidase